MLDKQLAGFVGGRILLWLQGYIGRFSTLFFFWGGGWVGGGGMRGPIAVQIPAPIFHEGLLLGAQFLSRLPPDVQFKFSCFSKKLFGLFLI